MLWFLSHPVSALCYSSLKGLRHLRKGSGVWGRWWETHFPLSSPSSCFKVSLWHEVRFRIFIHQSLAFGRPPAPAPLLPAVGRKWVLPCCWVWGVGDGVRGGGRVSTSPALERQHTAQSEPQQEGPARLADTFAIDLFSYHPKPQQLPGALLLGPQI